jgi:HlyD family secretion protein
MKRFFSIFGIVLALLLAAGGGWYLFGGGADRDAAAQAATGASVAQGAAGEINASSDSGTVALDLPASLSAIVADAKVVPVQAATLSLPTGGVVAEVLVDEGVQVKAGDLLLRLNGAQQQVSVTQAQAQLQRAQAALADLTAGARDQEIASAQAAVDAASARLTRLTTAAAPGEIAQAEAALASANASLAKLYEGPDQSAFIAARADLFNAQAALTQAQRAYDQVKSNNEIGALPQSAALQTATNNFEAAQARYDLLNADPSAADVARVAADVQRQSAGLETLRNTLPSDTAQAEADLAAAQAQLELLLAGARPEQLAIAQADVAAATAQLQQALVALADTELRAPFAGTIAELNINVGEQVSPGAAVATLADLGAWQIETSDLKELDIARVQPGTRVQLTFDALPDLALDGTVTLIRPRGGDNRGDVVYTAVIEPLENDPRLLWNMTAVVTVN